jgi:TolB protein
MLMCLLLILAATGTISGEIAFMREGHVHIVDIETNRERLLYELEYNRPLVWSSDGRHLLVWKHSEIGWDLWRLDLRDEVDIEAANLTNTEFGGCRSASYSPDGTRIAFMRDDPMGVWMMNADGSDMRQLNKRRVDRDSAPQWSPDGRKLLYVTHEYEERRFVGLQIREINMDSQEDRVLMRGTSPRWITVDQILFTTSRNGRFTLLVSDLDGSNERRLSHPSHDSWSIALSPDGERVAYIALDEDRNTSLVIVSVDGPADSRTLLARPGLRGPPAWSPDSATLAVTSQDEDEPGLWIIEVESGESRKIGDAPYHCPAWRPQQSEPE